MDADLQHCRKLVFLMLDYVDTELSPEDTAKLESHLADCQSCRALLQSLRQTVDLLAHLPTDPLPADHVARLKADLHARLTSLLQG